MSRHLLLLTLALSLSRMVSAAELKPATVKVFDHYVQLSEQRMAADLPATFLRIDGLPPTSAMPVTRDCGTER